MDRLDQMTVIADRYEISGTLDVGGMGVVYRATDRRLGRPVAVKVVRTTEPRLAERSAREARLLARVDHPNVVRVYDAGLHDDHPFIVTELVAGRPLSSLIAAGPLPPERTAAIGAGAAAGLAATHRAGIVHRDLKPANILVSDQGTVRLLDYGVASSANLEGLTLEGEVVGTPRYLAPEQVSGGVIGQPADVYALGLVLIECLTGQHPFGGTAVESMGARLTRDPDLPDWLDDRWRPLLAAMTARAPDRRPSASAAVEGLGAVGAGSGPRSGLSSIDATVPLALGDVTAELAVSGTSEGAGEPGRVARRRGRRRWAIAALAFVLVVAATTAGAWVMTDSADDGGTVPTTTSAVPVTTTPPTTRATTTTIRPTTTTTAPPTTTTTTGRGKGGKPGKGRPGG